MNKEITEPLKANIEKIIKTDQERRVSRDVYYSQKVKKPAPKPEIKGTNIASE